MWTNINICIKAIFFHCYFATTTAKKKKKTDQNLNRTNIKIDHIRKQTNKRKMQSNKANIQFFNAFKRPINNLSIFFIISSIVCTCISQIIAPQRNWKPISLPLCPSMYVYFNFFILRARILAFNATLKTIRCTANVISRSENKTNSHRTYTMQSFSTSKGL